MVTGCLLAHHNVCHRLGNGHIYFQCANHHFQTLPAFASGDSAYLLEQDVLLQNTALNSAHRYDQSHAGLIHRSVKTLTMKPVPESNESVAVAGRSQPGNIGYCSTRTMARPRQGRCCRRADTEHISHVKEKKKLQPHSRFTILSH